MAGDIAIRAWNAQCGIRSRIALRPHDIDGYTMALMIIVSPYEAYCLISATWKSDFVTLHPYGLRQNRGFIPGSSHVVYCPWKCWRSKSPRSSSDSTRSFLGSYIPAHISSTRKFVSFLVWRPWKLRKALLLPRTVWSSKVTRDQNRILLKLSRIPHSSYVADQEGL